MRDLLNNLYLNKFMLYFNTVKYLKVKQIFFRIYYSFFRPSIKPTKRNFAPCRNPYWVTHKLFPEKINKNFETSFIGVSHKLDLPSDWNCIRYGKLWLYNLHYFDDFVSFNSHNKYEFHLFLLDNWISNNSVGDGCGWDSYTISLRFVNVFKAFHAGLNLYNVHFQSLYDQANFLSKNLEKHLLGNHYFVNLKALLFASIFFENSDWYKVSISCLESEICEQILDDGVNYELSPMYHSLILVDMLDIYNLCLSYPNVIPSSFKRLVHSKISKMLDFMLIASHNDDGVSFFNDSVNGVAPTQNVIISYAKLLGFDIKAINYYSKNFWHFKNSGYMVATDSGNKLLFDACNVGPDYIPGHAHADTLSFELSIGNERVFVNSGISQYGLGAQRLNERKTLSHNTVEVDGLDSSQVWSSFRVAKRACITESCAKFVGSKVEFSACHNGYYKIYGGPNHKRTLLLGDSSLQVKDELDGPFHQAIARFYLHPDLVVSLENNNLRVVGNHFELFADLTGHQAALAKSNWHPGFGISQQNNCLEITFSNPYSQLEFTWNVK